MTEAEIVALIVARLEEVAEAEMAGAAMLTKQQRAICEHRQLAVLAAADEIRHGHWKRGR